MNRKRTYNYLYYKLYRANLIGSGRDIAEWSAMFQISGLIGANMLVIGAFLRKIDLLPVFFSGKRQVIIFMVCLFVLNYFLFLHNKRYKTIVAEYEQESEPHRKKGNLIAWLYVIISFLLIFVVAFYKPGKI